MCVCVCACACVRACARACVRACVRACQCFRWEASLDLKHSILLSSLGLFSGRTTSVCILFCRTFVCQFYFRILFTSVPRYAIGYTYLKYMDCGSLNDSVDHSKASSPPLMLNVSATLSGTTFKAGKADFLWEYVVRLWAAVVEHVQQRVKGIHLSQVQ